MPEKRRGDEQINADKASDMPATCIEEIDVDRLQQLRKIKGAMVIDVRETGELPLLPGNSHLSIPMSGLENKWQDIAGDDIIFICQHGIRSLLAAEFLHEQSPAKRVYSLKGGLVKWLDDLEKLA